MSKLIRITTVPISLKYLIAGQMEFMGNNGFEVVMMSADGPEVAEVCATELCSHEVVPLTRKMTPLTDLKALWILYRKLRRHRPSIVHTHTPKAGLIGMWAAWLARVPIRIHTVAGLPLETSTGLKRLLLRYLERLTYVFSTEVWPNSQSLLEYILKARFVAPNKVRLIGKGSSNGIDINEYNPNTLDVNVLAEIKHNIQYDPSRQYILFVGRVVRDKGIEELIWAFTKLTEEFENLQLLLVGAFEPDLDPLSANTRILIESRDDINATGFSTYVKYYMHLADLLVFPSHREGFPSVPMQAALMDCPVVASRIKGNIDIIEDNSDGILHTKRDRFDLLDKVRFALKNKREMQGFNHSLKKKIARDFSRKYVQSEILERYTKLLKKNRKQT